MNWVQLTLKEEEIEAELSNDVGKKWQQMWDTECSREKWVKKLVPKVTNKHMALVERPNFFLSQAVTGRGAFGAYLYKIRK